MTRSSPADVQPFYESAEEMQEVLTDVSEAALRLPGVADWLARTPIVVRLSTVEPSSSLVINGRTRPPRIETGSATEPSDFGLRLTAQLLHSLALRQVSLRSAFQSGGLRLEGSLLRAISIASQLGVLFDALSEVYLDVLRQRGLWPAKE